MKKKKINKAFLLSILAMMSMTATLVGCSDPTTQGGSSSPTSVIKTGTVKVEFDSAKGELTVSKQSGNVGDEITVNVSSKEGFDLESLTANDKDIKETKKFKLVEGENVVKAVFVAKETPSYKAISTAEQLIELLSKQGEITETYHLEKNIDLGGKVINGRANESVFNGILDGQGHSITNFVVKNDATTTGDDLDKATGLFHVVTGTVKNLHLKGTIDSAGFSGLLCKEIKSDTGLIENCLFEATNLRSTTDWTWCRNGVIASTINEKATIKNCVTNLDAGSTGAMCFPFIAYTWNGKQTFEHLYSNIPEDKQYPNYYPFSPDGTCADSKGTMTDVTYTPFAETPASKYALDKTVWNLVDNKMPTLKHFGETAVTVQK